MAVLTFSWPSNWKIQIPLATILGPWLAIRLGVCTIEVGILGLSGSIMLMIPYCFRQRVSTFLLLVFGFGIWCIFGFVSGLLLWV